MGVLAELHTANKSDSTHSAATAPSIIRAPSKVSRQVRTKPRGGARVRLLVLALFMQPGR